MKSKKALYNIVTQAMYEIVAMICGLILPRIILSYFGSEYNGIVSSITQFLDYISLLTLGISGSTRVAIYKAGANDDNEKVSALLKATENYMRKIAFIFIGYMMILAIVFPFFCSSSLQWLDIASLVIIIGLGVFAEYFFGITYKTYLMANQGIYTYNIIQIGVKIVSTILSVILIYLNQSIQIVKLGSAVCFVASPLILNYIVRKKYHINKNAKPDNSALDKRKDVMAHSIANCIHQYTDIFLLTIFSNPITVSIYSVYNLILGSLRKIQSIFTSGLEGAFGNIWAKKEYEKFEKNFSIFEFLMFSFVAVVFSCAMSLILPFINLYTLNVNDANYILPEYALISIITYAMYSLRTPYLTAVQAAGKYKETKKGAFIEAGLNLVISFIGVFKFGIIGVMFGTLVANIFRTVQYIVFLSNKMLNRKLSIPIQRFIILIIIFILSINANQNIVLKNVEINSWSAWIISGIFCFIITGIITMLMSIIFDRNNLKNSFKLLKKMIKRREKIN